jgi:IclR family transcriptional regulator, KDG regulon repressor
MPEHASQPSSGRRGVQSLERAIKILETIAAGRNGLGIVEISQRAELPASTVHRLLSTLVDRQLIAQDIHTGQYKVGIRSFEIGSAFLKQAKIGAIARPKLEDLSRITMETVNLAFREDTHATYVDQVQSDREIQVMPRTGARLPLYCTGVGKVFLAGLSRSECLELLSKIELKPRTVHTKRSIEEILEVLDDVQIHGYTVNDQELHIGVRCVAAPIFNHLGETCAAVSVTGTPTHLVGDHLDFVIQNTCVTAQRISSELGYRMIE